jgi:hypothetical protein
VLSCGEPLQRRSPLSLGLRRASPPGWERYAIELAVECITANKWRPSLRDRADILTTTSRSAFRMQSRAHSSSLRIFISANFGLVRIREGIITMTFVSVIAGAFAPMRDKQSPYSRGPPTSSWLNDETSEVRCERA